MYKIIPKENLKVINPDTLKRVPKDGIVIRKMNSFWNRRLDDGDIKVEDLSEKKKPKQISETKKEEGKK